MKKTYSQKTAQVSRNWHLVDAKDRILGEVAQEVAKFLIGKHKPTYTPHIDAGDYVVVINASQVKLTGKKVTDKTYFRHSGFPGGYTILNFAELMEKFPTRPVQYAVKGMLPKNKLRADRVKRLKVYEDEVHPHGAHFSQEK